MSLDSDEYIVHMSPEWKSFVSAKDGGIYLISTDELFSRGIAKVGLAQNFNHRMQSYRSCFGWWDRLYILGLIITSPAKARVLEKKIHKMFDNRRIPYSFTGIPSEWIELANPLEIKTKFEEFRGKQGIKNVILKFDSLSKAPIPNLDLKSVKKKKGDKYLIEFPDGTTAEASLSLLKKTVDVPALRDWKPELKEYQKEFDNIMLNLARTKTAEQIRKEALELSTFGDIGDVALKILQDRIAKRQNQEADKRLKRR